MNKLQPVEYVDLDKFMGDWYVIANIPTWIEKGAHNALEQYFWNDKGYIDVIFSFNQDSFSGTPKKLTQKAYIYNKKTNAEWRIQPFWPLKLPYLVIDLDEEYSYTVIGYPSRKFLWIMSRSKSLNEEILSKIYEKLNAQGYDTSLIQQVPHSE
ncbi:MAG: hypothetical protein CMG75_03835 [Candidatus Marinimicrobia bacterium]|nr:hypothetical protein [Candidatus Neomarinimicrobiota bacterium]|tara:strand:- start:1708 stop:2169 length:462 start_codon:yes stop_codon:yes gene_type:complete